MFAAHRNAHWFYSFGSDYYHFFDGNEKQQLVQFARGGIFIVTTQVDRLKAEDC